MIQILSRKQTVVAAFRTKGSSSLVSARKDLGQRSMSAIAVLTYSNTPRAVDRFIEVGGMANSSVDVFANLPEVTEEGSPELYALTMDAIEEIFAGKAEPLP